MKKLILRSSALPNGFRELFPADLPIVLGRSRHADITIDDDLLSRKHSQISFSSLGQFEIRDLDSTNLTIVNERDIDLHLLTSGDRIILGDTEIVVDIETPQANTSEQTTRDLNALPGNYDQSSDE